MNEIIFYNGFNLLVDIILVFTTYKVAKGIGKSVSKNKRTSIYLSGYVDGYRKCDQDNTPF
jgi:hypothetical protein